MDWIHTNVAPNRCPVNGIVVPDDRVDEHIQTTECGPKHEETRPRVPCLQMPRKGNEDKDETNE